MYCYCKHFFIKISKCLVLKLHILLTIYLLNSVKMLSFYISFLNYNTPTYMQINFTVFTVFLQFFIITKKNYKFK